MPGDDAWNILTPYLNGLANQTPQLPTAAQTVALPGSPFANQTISPYYGPSILQQDWASLPGRMFQGGVIDPALGLQQSIAHLAAYTGLPGGNAWAGVADNAVNGTDQNYNAARALSGQNPNDSDWVRTAGALASAWMPEVDVPEISTVYPRLSQLGGRVINGAINGSLTDAVNTSDGQSHAAGKIQKGQDGAALGPVSDYLHDAWNLLRGL